MDDGCIKATARDLRRQAIIDIARDIFLSGGYACASMSAIAARLGGSKGTLYNYFTSKEELFAAVIRDHCARKQAAMFDGLQATRGDLVSTLQGLGERYVAILLSDDTIAFNRVVIAEAVRFPEIGLTLYDAGPRRGAMLMAAFLEEEMRQGRLRQADPLRAAEQLSELCLAGLHRMRLWNLIPAPTPEDISDNVHAALETFLAAYGAEGDQRGGAKGDQRGGAKGDQRARGNRASEADAI